MQLRIAVYRPNGRLLAEFSNIEDLIRVLEVEKHQVDACLMEWVDRVETKKTRFCVIDYFTLKEIDDQKSGVC